MMFIDSHCHLDYDVFNDDRLLMLQRAAEKNVGYFMTIGTEIQNFGAVTKLAEENPRIFATIGVHPHHADDLESHLPHLKETLRTWARHPRVVGLGETGLDYYYNHGDKANQQESFRLHLEVAQETGLPVIVHSRDAEEDTLRLLKEAQQAHPFDFLIHCFTASEAFAHACLDMGGYISISGIVTFKNAVDLQNTVKGLPLNRLLIETDAPYLAPLPYRGKRNEPSYVTHVAEKVADLQETSVTEIARQTTENYFRLFQKAAHLVANTDPLLSAMKAS